MGLSQLLFSFCSFKMNAPNTVKRSSCRLCHMAPLSHRKGPYSHCLPPMRDFGPAQSADYSTHSTVLPYTTFHAALSLNKRCVSPADGGAAGIPVFGPSSAQTTTAV